MAFKLRLPTLLAALRHLGDATPLCYWGECPRCMRTTPWHSTPDRGRYRCTACGQTCRQP